MLSIIMMLIGRTLNAPMSSRSRDATATRRAANICQAVTGSVRRMRKPRRSGNRVFHSKTAANPTTAKENVVNSIRSVKIVQSLCGEAGPADSRSSCGMRKYAMNHPAASRNPRI
jgi:hypothetical protein